MPTRHHAVVHVTGPVGPARHATRYIGGEVEELGEDRHRVHLRADSIEWMAVTVAEIALGAEVEVDGPPELDEALDRLAQRLAHRTGGGRGDEPGG